MMKAQHVWTTMYLTMMTRNIYHKKKMRRRKKTKKKRRNRTSQKNCRRKN